MRNLQASKHSYRHTVWLTELQLDVGHLATKIILQYLRYNTFHQHYTSVPSTHVAKKTGPTGPVIGASGPILLYCTQTLWNCGTVSTVQHQVHSELLF